MPRKKKVENKTAENTVTYTGNVTIEKVRANKVVKKTVIKNTGCLPLFKFIANCLTIATAENADEIGLFNNKPQYLNCFYKQASSIETSGVDFDTQQVKSYMKQTGVSITSTEATTRTPSDQKNAHYDINIKFLLQDNNFKKADGSQEAYKINILALYGSSNIGTDELPHAYIIIPRAEDYLKYVEGVNYIITWTLKIANN